MSEALAMPCHLKGMAKTWYDSLSSHTQQSMNLLKSAVLNRFKSSNNVHISVLTFSQKTGRNYGGLIFSVLSSHVIEDSASASDSGTASDFYSNERP